MSDTAIANPIATTSDRTVDRPSLRAAPDEELSPDEEYPVRARRPEA
jgi:hypothetical protein